MTVIRTVLRAADAPLLHMQFHPHLEAVSHSETKAALVRAEA